ncbi:MAG: helix-turn-helix domain-containing protein [Aristaeellaceae bacterium]
MNLAENIARLRREQGMTQEALAELIGVSSQTVSKWETSTTYPDVALLPVLADVFSVSIDALYGREDAQFGILPEKAAELVLESVRQHIVGAVYNPETDGRFEDNLAKYRKVMQMDDKQSSVIENDREVLYFREKLGALVLRKPEDGWNSLFVRDDIAALLRLLADEDFRRALQIILERRMLTFTVPSLMKQCGASDAANLERCLQESRIFARRELVVDETPLIYYELVWGEQQLFLLYAVLAFAREFVDYQAVHYCFIGNRDYFTP